MACLLHPDTRAMPRAKGYRDRLLTTLVPTLVSGAMHCLQSHAVSPPQSNLLQCIRLPPASAGYLPANVKPFFIALPKVWRSTQRLLAAVYSLHPVARAVSQSQLSENCFPLAGSRKLGSFSNKLICYPVTDVAWYVSACPCASQPLHFRSATYRQVQSGGSRWGRWMCRCCSTCVRTSRAALTRSAMGPASALATSRGEAGFAGGGQIIAHRIAALGWH